MLYVYHVLVALQTNYSICGKCIYIAGHIIGTDPVSKRKVNCTWNA